MGPPSPNQAIPPPYVSHTHTNSVTCEAAGVLEEKHQDERQYCLQNKSLKYDIVVNEGSRLFETDTEVDMMRKSTPVQRHVSNITSDPVSLCSFYVSQMFCVSLCSFSFLVLCVSLQPFCLCDLVFLCVGVLHLFVLLLCLFVFPPYFCSLIYCLFI